MKKKFFSIAAVAVLAVTMITTAFASDAPDAAKDEFNNTVNRYGFMMDDNGNFLEKETFEEKLDQAVEEGKMSSNDKDYYMYMYEDCSGYENEAYRNNRSGRGCH